MTLLAPVAAPHGEPSVVGAPSWVTLVTPPSTFLLDERVFVNLGILKVAAALEAAGATVEHLDLSGVQNYLDALEDHLRSTRVTAVGITTTTPQLPTVARIVERIREVRPDLRIVLGGPHVTLTHAAVKYEQRVGRRGRAQDALSRLVSMADVLVSGDGDLAATLAFSPHAPKLIDADDPRGGYFLSNAAYERTPYPARHLVDMESYRYDIDGHRSTSLIAQLGCPFGCGFCGGRSAKSLRSIRTRSVASIVEEVRQLHVRYGFTGFMFYDDELNVSSNLLALLDGLVRLQEDLGAEFRLRGFVKSELFNAEQAIAMRRAGFRWILSGFESGAPIILKNINKRVRLEDNTRTVDLAHAAGLKVKALMSVGHPGESSTTLLQTREWLQTVRPDDFDCSIITTYPGTPYYDEAVPHESVPHAWTYTFQRTGDRLHAYEIDFIQVAEYYKGNPDGGYRSYVFTEHLSAEDLVEGRNWIESSVRSALAIPYPKARPALAYEHSMGQPGPGLPASILRSSDLRQTGAGT